MQPDDSILKEKHFDGSMSLRAPNTPIERTRQEIMAEEEKQREEQFAKRSKVVSKTLQGILHRTPPRPPAFGINE